MMRTEDILSQLRANSTRMPTPTSQLLNLATSSSRVPTPTNDTMIFAMNSMALPSDEQSLLEDDANMGAVTETAMDDSIPIPGWFNLKISEIYNNLNPVTKKEQQDQRSWHKSTMGIHGKPTTSVGMITNCLLKIWMGKKALPDTLN
jgi:hypothetical protein